MQKTQAALARSRRASRREAAQNETQRVDTDDTAQHSASASEDASTAHDERAHVDTQDTARDNASDVQNASTHDNDTLHVDALDNVHDSASDVQSTATTQHVSAAHEALARAKEAQQRAVEAAHAARIVAQQAQRDCARLQRDIAEHARAAHDALYKIDVVTAGPLDGHLELRQALLAGGAIALHAFQSAVERGVLRVRVKKARVARAPSTTPRAPGRVMTADEISDVLARSAQGETVVAIGTVHGLHPVTVRAIIAGRIIAKQA
jgi:hypothetical protein